MLNLSGQCLVLQILGFFDCSGRAFLAMLSQVTITISIQNCQIEMYNGQAVVRDLLVIFQVKLYFVFHIQVLQLLFVT